MCFVNWSSVINLDLLWKQVFSYAAIYTIIYIWKCIFFIKIPLENLCIKSSKCIFVKFSRPCCRITSSVKNCFSLQPWSAKVSQKNDLSRALISRFTIFYVFENVFFEIIQENFVHLVTKKYHQILKMCLCQILLWNLILKKLFQPSALVGQPFY